LIDCVEAFTSYGAKTVEGPLCLEVHRRNLGGTRVRTPTFWGWGTDPHFISPPSHKFCFKTMPITHNANCVIYVIYSNAK